MIAPASVEQVQAVVARVAGRSPADAGPDTPLAEGGFWLDSVHLLETVIACEEAFGVIFDPSIELADQSLLTVRTLAEMIREKQKA